MRRFVATARANFADREDHHFPVIVRNIEVARSFAAELCDRNGWLLLGVRTETSKHNIPALAPLRWARRRALLIELDRRMGIRR